MLKKPRVRKLMDSEHVKGAKTLHKSVRKYFCNFFDYPETKSGRKTQF